jgi:hypothetical protein
MHAAVHASNPRQRHRQRPPRAFSHARACRSLRGFIASPFLGHCARHSAVPALLRNVASLFERVAPETKQLRSTFVIQKFPASPRGKSHSRELPGQPAGRPIASRYPRTFPRRLQCPGPSGTARGKPRGSTNGCRACRRTQGRHLHKVAGLPASLAPGHPSEASWPALRRGLPSGIFLAMLRLPISIFLLAPRLPRGAFNFQIGFLSPCALISPKSKVCKSRRPSRLFCRTFK